MLKGLFTSIFGATDQGIFDVLYSDHGASPPIKRTDIRLGDYGQAAAEDDEEEDAAPAAPAAPAAAPAAPQAANAPPSGQSSNFFSQDIAGFPLWLVGVAFLGFAWSYRRKRNKQSKQSTRRK